MYMDLYLAALLATDPSTSLNSLKCDPTEYYCLSYWPIPQLWRTNLEQLNQHFFEKVVLILHRASTLSTQFSDNETKYMIKD